MEYFEANGLCVKYTYGALAIDNISFKVERGEILTVYGESESGKTSLLKCIAGLLPIFKGKMTLDGADIAKMSVKDRDICLIQEDGGFFEGKSVFYNMFFPLKIRNITEIEANKEIDNALKRVDYDGDKNAKMKKLSPVDRVKIMFARAYTRNAKLYLIDNPLKILAKEERGEIFSSISGVIKEFSERSGVIYATDDPSEIAENGKVIYLNYGICLQQGNIADIRKFPQTLSALKAFSDVENVRNGTLLEDEEGIFLSCDGEKIYLERKNLLSDIFLGDGVVFAEGKEGIEIYDEKSERLIYFGDLQAN